MFDSYQQKITQHWNSTFLGFASSYLKVFWVEFCFFHRMTWVVLLYIIIIIIILMSGSIISLFHVRIKHDESPGPTAAAWH